jgi:Methyltransferase domain
MRTMVNILIHQFQRGGEVVDEPALEQFQKQWTTYQKVVDADGLSHKAVGELLHDTLNQTFVKSFSFLDIACGDASQMRQALPGTKIRQYHGIDLSEPALELAANNLKDMPFEVELDHCDFVEALSKRPGPADTAWCSLSIHHLQTDEKLHLMRAVHDATSTMLMIYEPTRQDGESRDQYLDRFKRVNRPAWTMLTDEEWAQVNHHVTTCDFPEAADTWLELGRNAGFSAARQIFLDPTGFYRVFRYDR